MEIRSETIELPSGGGRMAAWLAAPSGAAPRAAVIVGMEAFGLVPGFRREVERIASMGYLALAPDLYHRQAPDNTASYDELPKAIALMRKLSDAEALDDLRAALAHLRARPELAAAPIGVTGFCMGGRLAFLAACELPGELAACAPFYGGGIGALLDRADRIRCPLHFFFGERDFFIPTEEVQRIDERLRALGKDYAIELYAGAVHGFCAEERRDSYHAEAAADAWAKLEAFFAKRLAPRGSR
jgi:carboxymethylenebutenolidase